VSGSGGSSIYAAAGTYAHDIGAKCLADSSLSPSDFLLKKATIDGFEVECDMEMVESVSVYLDAIREDVEPGDCTWIEMPLLDAPPKDRPGSRGTADFVTLPPGHQGAAASWTCLCLRPRLGPLPCLKSTTRSALVPGGSARSRPCTEIRVDLLEGVQKRHLDPGAVARFDILTDGVEIDADRFDHFHVALDFKPVDGRLLQQEVRRRQR